MDVWGVRLPSMRGTVYFSTVTAFGVAIALGLGLYRRSFGCGYGMDGVALLCEDGIDGTKTQDRELSALCDVLQVYRVYTPRIPSHCLSCIGKTIIAGFSRCLLVRPVLTVILLMTTLS